MRQMNYSEPRAPGLPDLQMTFSGFNRVVLDAELIAIVQEEDVQTVYALDSVENLKDLKEYLEVGGLPFRILGLWDNKSYAHMEMP